MSSARESTARRGRFRGPLPAVLRQVPSVQDAWQRLLGEPWLWSALLIAIGTWTLSPVAFLSRVTPGTVAGRDFVATRDLVFEDEVATRARQEEARQKVLPLYDLDTGVIARRDDQVEHLFAEGRHLLTGARDEAARQGVAEQLTSQDPSAEAFRVSRQQAELLVHHGFSAELEDRLRGALSLALRRGIVANKALLLDNRLSGVALRNLETGVERVQINLFDHLGYPEETRDFLESEARAWGYPAAERRLLVELTLDNLTPNLHLNRSETLARQDIAAAGTGLALIQFRKGQIIARKGDLIDQRKASLIAQMRGGQQRSQLPGLVATFLLLVLAAAAVRFGVAGRRAVEQGRPRVLSEALLLLLLSLLGTRLGFLIAGSLSGTFSGIPFNSARSYTYAIPFAALAILAALLLGRNAALLLSLLLALLAGRMALEGDPYWIALYSFGGALAAVIVLDRSEFTHRMVVARVGLVAGGVNVAMALILAGLGGPAEHGVAQIAFDLACAVAGGLAAAAVASFAVPILESLFAITTDIKLVELSNTNLPLLRRLAFEAPGTFQHSLMVANLAKEACEAIGADPVLAYAGALYHDVGKVFRSEYFIENQRPGHNRHDKLAPSMSALILINHVKEGLELARQHHLPQVIQDAIEQHHGTRLIRYFYNRALEQHSSSEVREEKYRYPGPRPCNKVMGVLMLADAVEAASRTLIEPAPGKLRALIRTISDDCLHDGQLDETDLTLADIKAISEAFLRVLATIFHQRIDYPGFDFNAGRTRPPAARSFTTPPPGPSGTSRHPRPLSGALKVS